MRTTDLGARIGWRSALAISTVVALAFAAPSAGAAPSPGPIDPSTDATRQSGVDTNSAIARLALDPLATAARTKPSPGKKIDFSSSSVRSYRAELSAQRNDFKTWLKANAPGARVSAEYDVAVNAVAVRLNGTSLAALRSAPGVVSVAAQALYTPNAVQGTTATALDPDLPLIKAGGVADAGRGIKVAVIDTGIDITHPCFADSDNVQDGLFTNGKVVIAKVFNNKEPSRGYTPAAVQDHGTHVAGTVACNYGTPAVVNGVAIPYGVSGVAPAALLGSYNVFPGEVQNARSEDILNALQAAYSDGMDVANMSLGGDAQGVQDLLTVAVDNLDDAGMVVAVSAGNSGPGHFTVGSPGSAAKALTAGAASVGHFIGAPVTAGALRTGAAVGDFKTVTADVTAPLKAVLDANGPSGLSTACSPLPPNSLAGAIALISRGTCSFTTKIRNAEKAGAVVVLVANNVAGDPVAMGADGTLPPPSAPAYQVSLADVPALKAAGGAPATVGKDLSYINTSNDNIMAGFSSQGPTDRDWRVKPDVVAPGVNVLSSIPGSFCSTPPCWAFFQGTSMSSPHLAGAAAVVLATNPGWSAPQVRSAIVNTAQQEVLTDFQTGTKQVRDPNIVGAGLANVAAASSAQVAVGPVSTSFGSVPGGSGQSRSASVTLTNLTTAALTLSLSRTGSAMFSLPTGPPLTLSPAQSTTVVVSVGVPKGTKAGDYDAMIVVKSGGLQIAHSVLYVHVS